MAFLTRLMITLFGMALAVLFAVGVLCGVALYVAFSVVRWLVTGQKPQLLIMWQQIQMMRKRMQTHQSARWSGGPRSSDGSWHAEQGHVDRSGHTTDAVQDVVVREVHPQRQLPKDS